MYIVVCMVLWPIMFVVVYNFPSIIHTHYSCIIRHCLHYDHTFCGTVTAVAINITTSTAHNIQTQLHCVIHNKLQGFVDHDHKINDHALTTTYTTRRRVAARAACNHRSSIIPTRKGCNMLCHVHTCIAYRHTLEFRHDLRLSVTIILHGQAVCV